MAATRLNANLRDRIIEDILKDIPNKPRDIAATASIAIKDHVLESMPTVVKEVYNQHPEWLNQTTEYTDFGCVSIFAPHNKKINELDTLIKQWEQEHNRAFDVYNRAVYTIRQALHSSSTIESFCKKYPDLAKYAEPYITKNELQTNVLKELKQAGWPKEKTHGETKA